jgi:hypothetical protein
MSAIYLRPGVFRVRGAGIDIEVLAAHGCDAICSVIEGVIHD